MADVAGGEEEEASTRRPNRWDSGQRSVGFLQKVPGGHERVYSERGICVWLGG